MQVRPFCFVAPACLSPVCGADRRAATVPEYHDTPTPTAAIAMAIAAAPTGTPRLTATVLVLSLPRAPPQLGEIGVRPLVVGQRPRDSASRARRSAARAAARASPSTERVRLALRRSACWNGSMRLAGTAQFEQDLAKQLRRRFDRLRRAKRRRQLSARPPPRRAESRPPRSLRPAASSISAATSRSMIAIAGRMSPSCSDGARRQRLARQLRQRRVAPVRAALMPIANSSLTLPKFRSLASRSQRRVSIT